MQNICLVIEKPKDPNNLEKFFLKGLNPFLGIDEIWGNKVTSDLEFALDVRNSFIIIVNTGFGLEMLCEKYNLKYKSIIRDSLQESINLIDNCYCLIYIDSEGNCTSFY